MRAVIHPQRDFFLHVIFLFCGEVARSKSPLSPLFQRGGSEMSPFDKGGLRGIFQRGKIVIFTFVASQRFGQRRKYSAAHPELTVLNLVFVLIQAARRRAGSMRAIFIKCAAMTW